MILLIVNSFFISRIINLFPIQFGEVVRFIGNLKFFLGIAVALFWVQVLTAAPDFNFYHYGVGKGLPTELVKCAAQDQYGYIWVGTDEGLARFEGKRFTPVQNFPGGNYIKDICFYNDSLWVASDQGVYAFDPSKGAAVSAFIPFEKQGIQYPKQFFELANGELWLSMQQGVAQKVKNGWEQIPNEQPEVSGHFLRSMQPFELNGLNYVISFEGNVFVADGGTMVQAMGVSIDADVFAVYQVSANEVWVGTSSGIKQLTVDPSGHFNLSEIGYLSGVSSIVSFSEDYVLVGTWKDGLYLVDRIRGNYVDRVQNYPYGNVNDLLVDRSGEVWVVSDGGLVLGVVPPFKRFQLNDRNEEGYVSAVGVGRDGGVFALEMNLLYNVRSMLSSTTQILPFRKQGAYLLSVVGDYNSLWVGNSEGQVFHFKDGVQKAEIQLDKYRRSMYNGLSDGAGGAYFVCADVSGLYHISNEYKIEILGQDEFGDAQPTAMTRITPNLFWITTNKAPEMLFEFNNSTGEFRNVTPSLLDNMPAQFAVHDITLDASGNAYLASDVGLLRFNGTGLSGLWNFTDQDSTNLVKAVSVDNTGMVWLADQDGVIGFDPESNYWARYDVESGLPSTSISFRGIKSSQNGEVWVATSSGLAYINNAEYRVETTAKPDLAGINIDGQSWTLDVKKWPDLKPSSHFELKLSTAAYPGDQVTYRYRKSHKDGMSPWIRTIDPSIIVGNFMVGTNSIEIQARKAGGFHWSDSLVIECTVDKYWFQKWKNWLLMLVVLIVIVYMIVKANTERLKRERDRLNLMVTERTAEVEQQKEELLEKNQQIESSLKYAETIQQAILPEIAQVKQLLPDSFVMYQPRDIVSGDFYWVANVAEGKLVIAADCTGHGVPGALMSMISVQLLNKLIFGDKVTEPSALLTRLHNEIRKELKQEKSSGNRDGLDVSVVLIDESNQTLTFAGARNPLIMIHQQELLEYKGAARSVGGGGFMQDKLPAFESHVVSYTKGDMIYLFSDGYQDQFGGKRDRKFKVGPFKALLVEAAAQPVDHQLNLLRRTLKSWMDASDADQTDDILIVGIRL